MTRLDRELEDAVRRGREAESDARIVRDSYRRFLALFTQMLRQGKEANVQQAAERLCKEDVLRCQVPPEPGRVMKSAR